MTIRGSRRDAAPTFINGVGVRKRSQGQSRALTPFIHSCVQTEPVGAASRRELLRKV